MKFYVSFQYFYSTPFPVRFKETYDHFKKAENQIKKRGDQIDHCEINFKKSKINLKKPKIKLKKQVQKNDFSPLSKNLKKPSLDTLSLKLTLLSKLGQKNDRIWKNICILFVRMILIIVVCVIKRVWVAILILFWFF